MDEEVVSSFVLSGSQAREVCKQMLESQLLPERVPDEIGSYLLEAQLGPGEDWKGQILDGSNVLATWYPDGDEYADDVMSVYLGEERVSVQPRWRPTLDRVWSLLDTAPFELASFGVIHEAWYEQEYLGTGFGDAHAPHGFACAFRGTGHERLVSRRWLDYGPWRAIRGPNDLTLVQFHDLDVDAKRALEQAEPSHQRMGISRTGGFIQKRFVYAHDLKGLYEPDKKRHKVIVHGREVTQSEMLDAAALRHYRKNDPDKPLDSIAYVFAIPEEAHAHLHELWLREIEVWTFDPPTGKEIRLDEDYEPPPPVKPAWVQELEGREANRVGTEKANK